MCAYKFLYWGPPLMTTVTWCIQFKGGSLPSEPVLANSTRPKLSLAEYKELKIKFAEHFPGELLTPESTPSYMFLANLKDQIDSGTWTWTSWRHRISEHAEMVFQENRKPRSDHQLLQRMLNQQDLMDFPEANVPSGGPVEPVLLRFQTLLANALAMLQLVHLIVAKKFHHKFNELALAVPVDSSLRPPNLQEVLAKSVWLAVTSAMRDNSWSLSDTMSERTADRICRLQNSHVLVPINLRSLPKRLIRSRLPRRQGRLHRSKRMIA